MFNLKLVNDFRFFFFIYAFKDPGISCAYSHACNIGIRFLKEKLVVCFVFATNLCEFLCIFAALSNLIYMAKYSRELDETLERKVKDLANAAGFREMGITVEPIRLNSKKSYGEVIKANELVTLFTGDADMICIAVNEELFENLDEQSQDVLIESLLSQVFYDSEKEKISIIKPELNVGLGMYHKYKEVAVQKLELAYYTLQQLEEKRKEEKAAKKAAREAKKKGQ